MVRNESGAGDDQDLPKGEKTTQDSWTELRRSLDELSHLAIGRSTLKDALTSVAQLAVRAIPGAEGAGLTLLERDRANTIVSTHDFVTEVDKIQYGIGQGPCISAAAEGTTVQSPALGADSRWPDFGAEVARLDVHSALSLPLITPDGVVGAMNIYARGRRAFSDESVELGELFAVPAAIAVQNAQILAQARRLASELQHSLASRAVVDQAMGILMSRNGSSADEALQQLRTLSAGQHKMLHVFAASVVDEVVRRSASGTSGT